jgi:hypothetical protein
MFSWLLKLWQEHFVIQSSSLLEKLAGSVSGRHCRIKRQNLFSSHKNWAFGFQHNRAGTHFFKPTATAGYGIKSQIWFLKAGSFHLA